MRLEAIATRSFPPFASQICRFGAPKVEGKPSDVHILVGENGTGKTRLLSLMLAACGNNAEIVERGGHGRSVMLASTGDGSFLWGGPQGVTKLPASDHITMLEQALVADKIPGVPQGWPNLTHVMKTPALAFRVAAAIRDEKVQPLAKVDWDPAAFLLFNPPGKEYASLCQAITNIKIRVGMFVAGNPGGPPDRTVVMMARLEETLTKITGRTFIFVVEQGKDALTLRVRWGGVMMTLQQLPDGLRAVIGWLASCVAKLDVLLPDSDRPLEQPVILFLDEPETNLHPAWQRQILPALQLLLPNAQIFVATHSPFVVSSVNRGWIYILKAGKDGMVTIRPPVQCSKGDSYIDAVEDVLGLKEWYDPETEELLAKFRELRDLALKSFAEEDKRAVRALAEQIAKRSESLELIVGRELKQLNEKEKAVGR